MTATLALLVAASIGTSTPGVAVTKPTWMPSTVSATNYVGVAASMSNRILSASSAVSFVSLRDALAERRLFTQPNEHTITNVTHYFPAAARDCKSWPLYMAGIETDRDYRRGMLSTNFIAAALWQGQDGGLLTAARGMASSTRSGDLLWSSSILEDRAPLPTESDWSGDLWATVKPILRSVPTLYDITNDNGTVGWTGDAPSVTNLFWIFHDAPPEEWDGVCADRTANGLGLLRGTGYATLRESASGRPDADEMAAGDSLDSRILVRTVPMLAAKDVTYRKPAEFGTFYTNEATVATVTEWYEMSVNEIELAVGEEIPGYKTRTTVSTNRIHSFDGCEVRAQPTHIAQSGLTMLVEVYIEGNYVRSWFDYAKYHGSERWELTHGQDGWLKVDMYDGKYKGRLAAYAYSEVSATSQTVLNRGTSDFAPPQFGETTRNCYPCKAARTFGVTENITNIEGLQVDYGLRHSLIGDGETNRLYKLAVRTVQPFDAEYADYIGYSLALGKAREMASATAGWSDPAEIANSLIADQRVRNVFAYHKARIGHLPANEEFIGATHRYVPRLPDQDGDEVYIDCTGDEPAVYSSVHLTPSPNSGWLDYDAESDRWIWGNYEIEISDNVYDDNKPVADFGDAYQGAATPHYRRIERIKWNWRNLPLTGQ